MRIEECFLDWINKNEHCPQDWQKTSGIKQTGNTEQSRQIIDGANQGIEDRYRHFLGTYLLTIYPSYQQTACSNLTRSESDALDSTLVTYKQQKIISGFLL